MTSKQIQAAAAEVARHALCSARENGDIDAARSAAERVDSWRCIPDICGCSHLDNASDTDLRAISAAAVKILEGK